MRDKRGAKTGFLGIQRDITQRKQAELALLQSEEHLRTIVELEPECVKLLSPEGTLLEMNPAGLAMLEAGSLEEVRGHPVSGLIVPGHRAVFADLHRRVMQGASGSCEFAIVGSRARAVGWRHTRCPIATRGARSPACSASRAASSAPAADPAWPGAGTVLVVDDEETMRSTVARMMHKLGLEPVLAADGREAVEIFRADPVRFALVLLDLTMPHMDGEQTFTELRRLHPDVRVVLMSGFNAHEAMVRFTGKELASFLQKPFAVGDLRAVLQGVADQEASPATRRGALSAAR